ncbi:MAG: CDP-glycerol glycerophosphotransferase family protein [Bacteroidaceae bacterium]|nr:CDP-glycerol glycerophosphotransferase family protein [Bacteroidaceae bacterium]
MKFPIKKNKILFIGYYGSQYGCSPKYLSEHIVKTRPDWDVVWAFTRPEIYNIRGVRKVKYWSLHYFYELYTSRVVVTNYRMTEDYRKRKGQYYVMTWHSSLRLKKIEGDAEDSLPEHYVKMAKEDSKKIDLLLSGCKFSDEIFRRAFWYDGKILSSGTPRSDIFYVPDSKERANMIKKQLHLSSDTKILLYAPTFRKGDKLDCYDLNYDRLRCVLEHVKGGTWKILVRLHPHLLHFSRDLFKGYDIVDVTKYDDIQELLLISDILITDYSSLMFDFAETRRTCFLYVPDLIDYQKQDRSLYFDIKDLPFTISLTQDELECQLGSFDEQKYVNDINKFLRDVGSYEDGHASQRVTKYIEKWIQRKE